MAENRKKDSSHKLDMSIARGKLVINEEVYEKSVKAPTARDILRPNKEVIKNARTIEIVKGGEESKQKSHFGSFAAAVQSFEDVQAAYLKMKMKYADATHVSCAFRLPGANTPFNQDYIDDGEYGCGRAMLKVLKQAKIMNVAMFLVRYYGGKHLGVTRFTVFKTLAEQALKDLIATREERGEMTEQLPDNLRQPQHQD